MEQGRRVFFHVIGKPFLLGLVLPILVALIAVSFADTNTPDWGLVQAQLASAPIWQTALVVTVLTAGWTWLAGQALRPVWRQPMIGFLVRQPISRWQWVRHLAPNVCVALLPVASICWLIHPQTNVALHYIVFAGLAWPMLFGASYRGSSMLRTYFGGVVLFAALLLGYLYSSYFIYVALVAMVVQLPLSISPIPRQLLNVTTQSSRSLSDFSPVRTIMRRDLRCLLRTEWKRLLNLLVFSVLAPLMMLAFRINGGVADRAALLVAVILFSIAASTVYEPLERLKAQLGKEVLRLRWPISHIDRAMALVLLIGVLIGPSAALIGLFGSTMGYANGVAFVLFCLLTIITCACMFSGFLGAARSTTGLYLLALVCHGAIFFLVPSWIYIALAAVGIPVGFRAAADRLHRFAVAAEITQ